MTSEIINDGILLSTELKVRVASATDMEFITIPVDPKIKPRGVSFSKHFWKNFKKQLPKVKEMVCAGLEDKHHIFRQKYIELKNTASRGTLVIISTINSRSEHNYGAGQTFTPDEWSNLMFCMEQIDTEFELKTARKTLEEKEKKDSPLMFGWKWNNLTSDPEQARNSSEYFFTEDTAKQNAFSDPEIAKYTEGLIFFKEFVKSGDNILSASKFVKFAYCFLLKKQALIQSQKEGEGVNFIDCLEKVSIPKEWIYMMYAQYFLKQGLKPTSTGEQSLHNLLQYSEPGVLLLEAQILEPDTSAFYLLCAELYKDIEDNMPLSHYL